MRPGQANSPEPTTVMAYPIFSISFISFRDSGTYYAASRTGGPKIKRHMEERRIFPALPIVHHCTSLNELLSQCLIYPVALYTIVKASRMFTGHTQLFLDVQLQPFAALCQTTLDNVTISRLHQ